MSTTDTDETRANQDPREEPEWSRNEGSADGSDDGFEDESAEPALTGEPDYGRGFGEFTQNTGTPAEAEPLASGDSLDREDALDGDEALDRDEAGLTSSSDSQGSAELEGVARPEDLGGRDVGAGGAPLVAAEAQQEFLNRWTQVQVSFLEDPAGAVESAEALIQEISAAIRTSLEERGSALAAEGQEASDTEQLRLALRQYRAFIGVILPK